MATAQGHLNQTRQNIRPTKNKTVEAPTTIEMIEPQEPNNQITNQAFATIKKLERSTLIKLVHFPSHPVIDTNTC
jgi:hypothetical protein